MNRALRLVAALAIAAVTAAAVDRVCWQRYRCNLSEARAERTINRIVSVPEETRARIAARMILDEMVRCEPCSRTSVNHYMVTGAALRVLDRPDEAAEQYRKALEIDRRAELYLNIGLSELEAGRDTQAEDALTTAMIAVYSYHQSVPESMKFRVTTYVNEIYASIEKRRAAPTLPRELYERLARQPMK